MSTIYVFVGLLAISVAVIMFCRLVTEGIRGYPYPPGLKGLPAIGKIFDIDHTGPPHKSYARWAGEFCEFSIYTLCSERSVHPWVPNSVRYDPLKDAHHPRPRYQHFRSCERVIREAFRAVFWQVCFKMRHLECRPFTLLIRPTLIMFSDVYVHAQISNRSQLDFLIIKLDWAFTFFSYGETLRSHRRSFRWYF